MTAALPLSAYALVHVRYTLPPAVFLALLFHPLRTRLDGYKLAFLVAVAVAAATPWDAYLVRTGVWSYPPGAVLGTLYGVPYEEYFFFVVQTYMSSVFYLLLGKPVFHPAYLAPPEKTVGGAKIKTVGRVVMVLLAGVTGAAGLAVHRGGASTYLGLILVWATPVVLFLWFLSYPHILSLPLMNTLLPILLPTAYLWIVDTFALRRGTWVISADTKLGVYLWPGLEIEEAIFFLLSNTLIVLGQVAFDYALAKITASPSLFPIMPYKFTPSLYMRALFTPLDPDDWQRVQGMQEAVQRLRKKSRSFYLASAAFEGRLRADLLLLYSFCRVADDLIDDAPDREDANRALDTLEGFLNIAYVSTPTVDRSDALRNYVEANFPPAVHSSFLLLPTAILPRQPLADLLHGFATDLQFAPALDAGADADSTNPIRTEADLESYAQRVAGTVGELCLALVAHHCAPRPADAGFEVVKDAVVRAAIQMGTALQYVNIARDVWVDARLEPGGRVYIPAVWLEEHGVGPADVLRVARGAGSVSGTYVNARGDGEKTDDAHVLRAVRACRQGLLARAVALYAASRASVETLPDAWGARRGVRLAVEAYMEIGRVLTERLGTPGSASDDGRGEAVEKRKATVPVARRAWTAWKALAL